MKKTGIYIILCCITLISGCETVNDRTVPDMPTGYLCDILTPNYITLPEERKAIFRELEKRGESCGITVKIEKK